MSSKITIDLENKTGPGMEQIRRDLAKMGIEGDKTEKAMEQLNAELESRAARKQADEIKKLADEMDGTADKARELAREQEKLNKAMQDEAAAKGKSGWLEFAGKANVAAMAVKGVYEGVKKVGEGIRFLSEQGIPAFQKLESSGQKAMNAMLAAASGEGIAKGAQVASYAIEKVLVPMVGEASKVVNNLGEVAHAATSRLAALAGVDFTKQIAEMDAVAERLRNIKKELDKEATVKTGKSEGDKIEERRDAAKAQRAKDRLIAEQTSSAGIEQLMAQELANYNKMREKMKTSNAADQAAYKAAAERSAADLEKMEDKHTALVEAEVAARFEKHKKAQEDQRTIDLKNREAELRGLDEILAKEKAGSDAFREAEKRKLELLKKTRDEELKILQNRDGVKETAHAKEMERIQTRADKEIAAIAAVAEMEQAAWNAKEARKAAEAAAEQAKIDKLKAAMGGEGGVVGGADFMGRLSGGIKPRDMRNQIIKKREEDALNKWREEQRASGKMDQNNRLVAGDGDEYSMGRDRIDNSPAALARRTKAQEAEIRRKARMGTFKDARRGKIGNEEVEAAGSELLQQAGENLIKGNNLNQTQVGAMRQMIEVIKTEKTEKARLQDQINQMRQELSQIQGRGNNSTNRAQRAGG